MEDTLFSKSYSTTHYSKNGARNSQLYRRKPTRTYADTYGGRCWIPRRVHHHSSRAAFFPPLAPALRSFLPSSPPPWSFSPPRGPFPLTSFPLLEAGQNFIIGSYAAPALGICLFHHSRKYFCTFALPTDSPTEINHSHNCACETMSGTGE